MASRSKSIHTLMLFLFFSFLFCSVQADLYHSLLRTGQGSDLVVMCNGTTFKVHKAILASRSDFFKTACWGVFRVRGETNERHKRRDG